MSNYAWFPFQPSRFQAGIFSSPQELAIVLLLAILFLSGRCPAADDTEANTTSQADVARLDTEKMLTDYYHEMSRPKPFVPRKGPEFSSHQSELRRQLLKSTGLWPMPEKIALCVHQSEPLDHTWCTIRRVYYRLWPGVYSSGLLYLPKQLSEQPAPAMLCPHGHWKDGNAHPEVQRRCLNFARLGYVTFSSTQNHYEDLCIGVSHQTLMIWNNIRALDYLETLPEVDKDRIGVAGASGGGLQTQMIVALDRRVKAATVVGLTCDFREIMFPDRHHCTCNHFPGVMQFTDHPETSTLGLPAAIQFLTMNDWTRNFQRDNLPTIRQLYSINGHPDRVDCKYYDTPHSYDKEKRERTYYWMEKWLRGSQTEQVSEPETETFPVATLAGLSVDVADDKGFSEISNIYKQQRAYKTLTMASRADWLDYRRQMTEALKRLLGEAATLERSAAAPKGLSREARDGLIVQRVGYPSEGGILVPSIVLRKETAADRLPVVLILDESGGDKLLEAKGPDSPRELARLGSLVVLPDVRCFGRFFSTGSNTEALQRRAWERNGIVWGRPVPGMACTDLRGVLDGLSRRPDTDVGQVKLVSRNSGGLAIAAVFAAALDARITSIDVDLAGCCFQKRNLPLVSSVLQHGDVLQWASLSADRSLAIRNLPEEAGDRKWLSEVFETVGNSEGLRFEL